MSTLIRSLGLLVVVAFAIAWGLGPDVLRERLWWLLPESPVPDEVMALLPLPESAAIEDAGCVGAKGRPRYVCVVHASAAIAMEQGAATAAAAMADWEEKNWDQVPGRIQYGWVRGAESVSLAIHAAATGTTWSFGYSVADGSAAESPVLYRRTEPDPNAVLPPILATLPLPSGARLLAATTTGEDAAEAVFAVDGEAEAILGLYRALEGWETTMQGRLRRVVSLELRKAKAVLEAEVWTDAGQSVLVLRSRTMP